MQDMPPVPPAVVEFAEKHNIQEVRKDTTFHIKKEHSKLKNIGEAYCGYSSQPPIFKKQEDYLYDYYTFILVEDGNIRLATPEENEELNRVLFL